ncbi:LytTR family transcriptional regulator [Rhodobacteraceae bacterium F11138]|nr:LytTR family transcriptional regulator [Rhodobacteraceae bacterium F11138]
MIQTFTKSYGALLTPRNLVILGLCALAAALTGPFGTYQSHGFINRLLYWTLVGASSFLIGHGCHEIARRLVAESRPLLTDMVMVALMTALFTPLLWLMSSFVLIHTHGNPNILWLALYVAPITAGICIARRILPGFEKVGYFGNRPVQTVENPRLTRRLSPEFRGPILRLAGRDHFVDVVSQSGVETIRFRFADAIGEMDTVVGHCTHRSHWVVQDAVVRSEREKDKIFLCIANGDRVPVSRKYRPQLQEAGLL